MKVELPRKRGESEKSYEKRLVRHEAQEKKVAARDPNISPAVHVRFEGIEARIAGIEARLGLKLRSASPIPPAPKAVVQAQAPPPPAPAEDDVDEEPQEPEADESEDPYDDSAS